MTAYFTWRKLSLLLAMIAVLLLSGVTVMRRASSDAFSTSEAGGIRELTPAAPQSGVARQLIRVWVHEDDLYPAIIHVSPGPIFLRVENQTLKNVGVVVERRQPGEAAQFVTHLQTTRAERRFQEPLSLNAGEYVFYEQSRPELVGRIVVK